MGITKSNYISIASRWITRCKNCSYRIGVIQDLRSRGGVRSRKVSPGKDTLCAGKRLLRWLKVIHRYITHQSAMIQAGVFNNCSSMIDPTRYVTPNESRSLLFDSTSSNPLIHNLSPHRHLRSTQHLLTRMQQASLLKQKHSPSLRVDIDALPHCH